MATITNYKEILEQLDGYARYTYLLEKGRNYKESSIPMTDDTLVKGTYSDIWIEATETPVGWSFSVRSGALQNRGIAVMVCEILDGMTADELSRVVWQDFAELGKLFGKEDKKLIQALLNKCKKLSKGN